MTPHFKCHQKAKQMVRLNYFCNAPNQNGDIKRFRSLPKPRFFIYEKWLYIMFQWVRALRMSLFDFCSNNLLQPGFFWTDQGLFSKSFQITAYFKVPVLPKQNLQQCFLYVETIAPSVIILR